MSQPLLFDFAGFANHIKKWFEETKELLVFFFGNLVVIV